MDTHLGRLVEFCCCFNFQEIVKICLSTVSNQIYFLFQDFTDLLSVCESIPIASRWRCCQTYEIHSDACQQLSRSCDGFIGTQLPVQYVQSVGQGNVIHTRTFLPFTWMFLLSFWAVVFFIKHMALQPLQGHSNIWCCQLVMLCVKSVKDEKQVRAKFNWVDESNWRTLWSA